MHPSETVGLSTLLEIKGQKNMHVEKELHLETQVLRVRPTALLSIVMETVMPNISLWEGIPSGRTVLCSSCLEADGKEEAHITRQTWIFCASIV